jgi:hypothetical protein
MTLESKVHLRAMGAAIIKHSPSWGADPLVSISQCHPNLKYWSATASGSVNLKGMI